MIPALPAITVVAGLADLVATGGAASTLLATAVWLDSMRNPDQVETTPDREWREWVTKALVEMKDQVPHWDAVPPEERPHPSATDVIAVITEARRIYEKTADRKKRELLHRAVVNAFSPEEYEAGLVLRLLRILGELEYGDIATLTELSAVGVVAQVREWENPAADAKPEMWGQSLQAHHIRVLVDHGLVWTSMGPENREWGGGRFQARPTQLGRRLIGLVAERPT